MEYCITYWTSIVEDGERGASVLWLLVVAGGMEVVMELCWRRKHYITMISFYVGVTSLVT